MILTPKEKARELLDKFLDITLVDYLLNDTVEQVNAKCIEDLKLCKQCALIAVDETQQLIKNLSSCKNRFIYIVDEMNYWEEVKQEIEKL